MSAAPTNPQPFRLKEGDELGFEDDQSPTVAVWPGGNDSPAQRILDGLIEIGAKFPDPALAVSVIEEDLDLQSERQKAAWNLLDIGLNFALSGRSDGITSRVVALALILNFCPSEEMAAERFGLDRRAISRAYESLMAELSSQNLSGQNHYKH